jgi:hypothetical protein
VGPLSVMANPAPILNNILASFVIPLTQEQEQPFWKAAREDAGVVSDGSAADNDSGVSEGDRVGEIDEAG